MGIRTMGNCIRQGMTTLLKFYVCTNNSIPTIFFRLKNSNDGLLEKFAELKNSCPNFDPRKLEFEIVGL